MANDLLGFSAIEHPMAPVCARWCALLEEAARAKEERFGKYAREAYQFYNGAHDWMWKQEYARGSGGYLSEVQHAVPGFRMTVNRPFEAVAMFGPVLFHQYPEVTVKPTQQPQMDPLLVAQMAGDPAVAEQVMLFDQQQMSIRATASQIKQHYLNWLQQEGNKKGHSRRAITEAIVKGLGLTMTELYKPSGSRVAYPRSRHISCDQLLKDPDARYAEDVRWMSVTWTTPVDVAERKFGLPRGSLKGHLQSMEARTSAKGKRESTSGRSGKTHDLITYHEVYSKNGFGHRLKATNQQSTKSKHDFDFLGDFCRIVVAKGVPYPLNMPSWALAGGDEMMFQLAQWPVPFWTDEGVGGGWPVNELGFWYDTDDVWPISLIKPAIGELRFVNWCMSFLADKVAASAHDYIGILKSAGESIREQIANKRGPYTIIEIEELFGNKIQDVVSFLQQPNFSIDIWKMVSEVLNMIDKRTGLTELIYGLTGAQMRSATEANVRQDNINVRPQDMANSVEDWLSETAMKECEAAVWLLDRGDYEPVLGPAAAAFWEQYISTQDFDAVVRDYSYRITAGSARRPNREGKLQALTDFGNVALPVIQQFATQGVVEPWNAYVQDVAEVLQLDATRYLVQPPQLPEQPDEAAMKEDEHEQDLRITAEKAQLEMMLKARMADQEMEQDAESHEQELTQARAMAKARPKPTTNGARR